MNDEGLAELHTILKVKDSQQFGEGFEEDREALKDAEENCPVNIIRIEE